MSGYNNLKLENQLCFALYAANNSIKRAHGVALSTLDLTFTQYLILLVLIEEDGVSVKTIADKLNLDSPSVTPALKRMQMKGYIERKRSPSSQRMLEVNLTKEIWKLMPFFSKLRKNINALTGLNETEEEKLIEGLNLLAKNLET